MKAVLDTNVVASACFWRGSPFTCLENWAKGAYSVAVSPPLLAEYEETFAELLLEYPEREPADWVGALKESADLVFPAESAAGAVPDPFDEMVLECALAADADYIVSGDKKHLLPLGIFRGIRVVPPAIFLKHLRIGR